MGFLKRLTFYSIAYGTGAFWSSLVLVRLSLRILFSPRRFFLVKRRSVPPSALTQCIERFDGSLHSADRYGLKLNYVAAGDTNKPLMLFLHGFPEFWYSWRHQIGHFSDRYRVVALDMRGYNLSDKPPLVSDYDMDKLVDDVEFLIRTHLQRDRCVLVAHDWGGVVAWHLARRHPELLERLIILNAPAPRTFQGHIFTPTQFLKSWYMFFFLMPWLPELAFRCEDFAFLEQVFKKCRAFNSDDLECYKYAFAQPGALTGPLNYYRAMFAKMSRNQPREASPGDPSGGKSRVKTLLLWGTADIALDTTLAERSKLVTANWADVSVRLLEGGDHFLQQDLPHDVNREIDAFLSLHP